MLRKVITSETHYPVANFGCYHAHSLVETLECGHVVCVKGSRGMAHRRKCHECTSHDNNELGIMTIGDIEEKWDPETRWPYWVNKKGERVASPR